MVIQFNRNEFFFVFIGILQDNMPQDNKILTNLQILQLFFSADSER